MQKRWNGKNVDLTLLTTRIGKLFKAKDFEAIKGEISDGYRVLAANSPHYKLAGHISATIEGKPDDFSVEFQLCNQRSKHASKFPTLMETMFIGGFLSLRKLKSNEAWILLEKELWKQVENLVYQLSGSSKNSISTSKC